MSEATMSREDEIKARLEKATKGTREVGGPYPSLCVMVCVDGGSTHPEYAEPPHYEMVCKIYDSAPEYLYECAWQGKADADFIANAPADIDYLLDRVAMFEKLYGHAIECVDKVFQDCSKHEAMLPDFLKLRESKFNGVVTLAEKYKALLAEIARLRAENEELRKR